MKLLNIVKILLVEEMISTLKDWEKNIKYYGNLYGIPVSINEENNDILYLFVGFTDRIQYMEYSYSFMLFDKNLNPKTDFLVKRDEVKDYLPLTEKSLIFPIIKKMTRKLLTTVLPDKIVRKTIEPINDNHLKRYDEITNIMVDEFGYKLISKTANGDLFNWVLVRERINDSNKDLNEKYEFSYETTLSERIMLEHGEKIFRMLKEDGFPNF